MDKEAAELVKVGLRLYSRETSPDYRLVRDRLLGYLAAHRSTVEQLALREQSSRENVALLSAFTKLLPKATQYEFSLDDPYLARIIQANVVWGDDFANRTPFYIVGRRVGKGSEAGLLLTCAAEEKRIRNTKAYSQLLDPGYLSRRTRRKIAAQAELIRSDYPTPKDMEQLFDPDSHKLILKSSSPGSTVLKRFYPEITDRLTDEDFALYDVPSHLHRLATAFGLETELESLINEHSLRV